MPPTPLFPAPTHSKERSWQIPNPDPLGPSHLPLQAHERLAPWADHSFLAPGGKQRELKANQREDRKGNAPSPDSMRARFAYLSYQKREAERREREAAERREREFGSRTRDDPLSSFNVTHQHTPAPSAWKHHDPLTRPGRLDAGFHPGRAGIYPMETRRARDWEREAADDTPCCCVVM